MQKVYCDKCKKEIGNKNHYLRLLFFGLDKLFDFDLSHLCEKCAEKFVKIIKKFLAGRNLE